MARQTTKSTAQDMQTLFDPQGYQDAFKTMASMNERMTSLAIEAGIRATDVASETAKEAFSNVRDLTQVRDDPAEYGKAVQDFFQKQTELFTRTAQALAAETQKVGSETADMASKAGEEITGKVAASVESVAQTARSTAV